MNPAIDVVMATYNGEDFLQAQLQSIAEQTLSPKRIIISDDASSDDTLAIIERFSLQHPGLVETRRNYKNIGPVANFIKALKFADPMHYVALCDQDDLWTPERLAKGAKLLATITRDDKPCLVYSDLSVFNSKGAVSPSFWSEQGKGDYEHNFQTLLFGNLVTGCTTMMNPTARALLLDMPVDVDIHDAWLALLAFGLGIAVGIREPLVQYRQHSANVTYQEKEKKNKLVEKLQKHMHFFLHPETYLQSRLTTVQAFSDRHAQELDAEKRLAIEQFLMLKGKSYFSQKMAMRTAFRPYWLKAKN
ncbi:MAG: glycosyltransferase family 2 protein [Bacteroidota bacterium]